MERMRRRERGSVKRREREGGRERYVGLESGRYKSVRAEDRKEG